MQAHTYSNIRDFTDKTRKALEYQRQEEIIDFTETVKNNTAKDLELMGLVMTGLKLKSTKGGLYGRLLFTLQHHLYPADSTSQKQILDRCKLPESKFGVGDNVGIYNTSEYINGKPLATGVVHRKTEHKLVISIDTKENQQDIEGEVYGNHLSVCCTINEVTYTRYSKILKDLEATDSVHKSKNIIDTLFSYVKYPSNLETKPLQFVDQTLNQKQKQAVTKCISTGSVHLVHGPPGTGKTKTICQVIVQAAKKGWKVLATAGSNIAVDNIVERIGKKAKVCRIGHPSRMIESVYEYSLDNLLFKSSFNKVVKDLKRELDQKRSKYVKTQNRSQRKDLRDEMKEMRSQIRGVEAAAIKQLLDESEVICCTNTGAGQRMFKYQLSKSVFDLVVIDECAQSVQVSCWIPLLKGKKAVLAGDHLQLPPTIKSKQAEKILSYTLFDRAMKQCPVESTLLTTQYRMNKAIMSWSSQQFYDGKLQADQTVSDHTIKQIGGSVVNFIPLMFIDTQGCEMGENVNKQSSDISKSKFNLGEADIVKVICQQLVDQGLKNDHIGVITPYNAQVSLIKNLLDPLQKQNDKIEVSTVDGFQGREKQCIIISMVRSNPIKQVGFLSDYRRMNVAVTRAKRFVCLVGDSHTVVSDPSLKTLVEHFTQHGEHRNAIQFRGDEQVRFGMGWIKHDKKDQKDKKEQKDKPAATINQKQSEKAKKNKKKKKQEPEVEIKQTNSPGLNLNQQKPNRPLLFPLEPIKEAEDKYIPQIEIFLTSGERQLVFENLSGFDRKIIHSIAEEFDIEHETSADKKKLILTKNIPLDEKKIQSLEDLSKATKADLIKFTQLTARQKKDLSKLAKQLKLIVDFKDETNELTITKVINKPPPPPAQKPKPKKKKEDKKKQQQQFDEIAYLDMMMNDDKRCHFPKEQCKAKIEHLGMRCQFCNQMFCMRHLLAELHGCGQKAQIHARQKHKVEYEKRTGEFISDKQKDALRQKLQKKIKDAEKDRAQQIKKKDKK